MLSACYAQDKIDTSMHLHFCETFCYEHGMTNQKISSCYVIYIFTMAKPPKATPLDSLAIIYINNVVDKQNKETTLHR